MLGKLKKMASGNIGDEMLEKYAPELKAKLDEVITSVNAEVVTNNESYLEKVVPPVRIALDSAASGATKLIPGFNKKFDVAMLHLRDELVVASEGSLSLAGDFDERLPEVLKAGFEKAKEA